MQKVPDSGMRINRIPASRACAGPSDVTVFKKLIFKLNQKKNDYFGIFDSIHSVIFKTYMTLYREKGQYKLTNSIPRNFDRLYTLLFDTYLNWDYSKTRPNLGEDYISKFASIFENKIHSSINISKQYLANLNKYFETK